MDLEVLKKTVENFLSWGIVGFHIMRFFHCTAILNLELRSSLLRIIQCCIQIVLWILNLVYFYLLLFVMALFSLKFYWFWVNIFIWFWKYFSKKYVSDVKMNWNLPFDSPSIKLPEHKLTECQSLSYWIVLKLCRLIFSLLLKIFFMELYLILK